MIWKNWTLQALIPTTSVACEKRLQDSGCHHLILKLSFCHWLYFQRGSFSGTSSKRAFTSLIVTVLLFCNLNSSLHHWLTLNDGHAIYLKGFINAVAWLGWCYRVRKRQPYVWKAATTVVLLSALLMLELLDFPPFFWTIDAHSLWHLGTIPLPFLWYR